jgi:hypothetical protein
MQLLFIPLMTALLAWFIAWFFVKALFINWNQGLQKQIAGIQLDAIISKKAINRQFEAVRPYIDEQLDLFFTTKLGEKLPIVSMFIGDKTVAQLKSVFLEELQLLFPELVEKLAENTKADFAQNITAKWKPILEPSLLKATRKYRLLACIIGLAWGFIMQAITHHS